MMAVAEWVMGWVAQGTEVLGLSLTVMQVAARALRV